MDAVKEAQELYIEAMDAMSTQRKQIEDDLAFSDPSNPEQWDEVIKNQRENDPGGARPCLCYDQLGQYVANVAGQVEQRPPALHAIPVGGGADKKVAESLDGFFRHIEHASRAQQHYAIALTSSARAGVGYLIIRPEVIDRALGFQEPRIGSEGDPLRVVFDPWSVELDGSDANFGYHLTPFSKREFERKWPGKPLRSFGEPERTIDERDSINVVEQWRIEDKSTNIVVYRGLDGAEASLPEDDFHLANQRMEVSAVIRNYKDKYRCVKWSRMSGADVLDEEKEYPATSIGIVPVYGYVGWSNGRMSYCGISRRGRMPQQSYNYHMSEIHAYMGQAPKAPWLVAIESMTDEKVKALWDKASVEARAWLPYKAISDDGTALPPPTRSPIAVNLTNHIQGAVQAKEDIQASIGMYQANLGAPSNETSGIAIENRKEQGEASTAHFPAHLAASLGQVGKICVEMIPRLIDTKRQIRILSIDNTPSEVTVDPEMQGAMEEGPPLSINPNVGKYDVRVVVGASFSTQRQQAQEAYIEMMRANPELMPVIGPLWAQTLDVPHADKLAQVLTAMAPEPVKAILQPQDQENSAQLKAENEQLKQALQEAIQHANDAQEEMKQAAARADEAEANAEAKRADIVIKDKEFQFKLAQAHDEHQLKSRELALKAGEIKQRGDQQAKADQDKADAAEKEAQDTDPEQDDAMEEALAKAVEQMAKTQDQTNKAIAELAQGQADVQKLMKTLISVSQAPRKREISYDANGNASSRETVEMPPTSIQ